MKVSELNLYPKFFRRGELSLNFLFYRCRNDIILLPPFFQLNQQLIGQAVYNALAIQGAFGVNLLFIVKREKL